MTVFDHDIFGVNNPIGTLKLELSQLIEAITANTAQQGPGHGLWYALTKANPEDRSVKVMGKGYQSSLKGTTLKTKEHLVSTKEYVKEHGVVNSTVNGVKSVGHSLEASVANLSVDKVRHASQEAAKKGVKGLKALGKRFF